MCPFSNFVFSNFFFQLATTTFSIRTEFAENSFETKCDRTEGAGWTIGGTTTRTFIASGPTTPPKASIVDGTKYVGRVKKMIYFFHLFENGLNLLFRGC
jgi:hypothetical protein